MTTEALSTPVSKSDKRNQSLALHQRIALLGWIGWIFGFFMTGVLVFQSISIASVEKEVLAVDRESGKVIGHVVFDEDEVRSQSAVIKDIKQWTSSYLSLNSETILEDAAIALNHMEDDEPSDDSTEYSLQQQTLEEWTSVSETQQLSRLASIEASKNVARTEFDDVELTSADNVGDVFYAVVTGRVISGIVSPKPAPFKYQIKFKLVPRTTDLHLGIVVYGVQKI